MSYKTKGLVGAMEEAVVQDQPTPSEGEIISASAEMDAKINDFNDDSDYLTEVEDEAVALEKIRDLLLAGDPSVTAQSIARVHTEAFARRHGIRLNSSPSLESYSGNVVAIEGVLGKVGKAVKDAVKYVIKKLGDMIDWFLNLVGLKKKQVDNMDKNFEEGKAKMTEKFEQVLKKAPDPKKEAENIKADIKSGDPVDVWIKNMWDRVDKMKADTGASVNPEEVKDPKPHKFQNSDDITDVTPKGESSTAETAAGVDNLVAEIKQLSLEITALMTENASFTSAKLAKLLWFGGLGSGDGKKIPKELDISSLDRNRTVLSNSQTSNVKIQSVNHFTTALENPKITNEELVKEYETLYRRLGSSFTPTTEEDKDMVKNGNDKLFSQLKSDWVSYARTNYLLNPQHIVKVGHATDLTLVRAPELTDEQYSEIVIKVPTKEEILGWKRDCHNVENAIKELRAVKAEVTKTLKTFSNENRGEVTEVQQLGLDIASDLIRTTCREVEFLIATFTHSLRAYTTLSDILNQLSRFPDLQIVI